MDMEAMNWALLAKWWWRFFNERHLIWGRLITALYYTRRRPLHEGRSFRPHSQWWRSVMKSQAVFKCGASFALGDGKLIRWWTDIWIDDIPLSTRYPGLFQGVVRQEVTVAQCWNDKGWRWRFISRGLATRTNARNRQQITSLKTLLSQFSTSVTYDRLKWRWTNNQIFTVKSTYNFITYGGLIEPLYKHLWGLKIPLKHKVFVWILLRKRLLTADRLFRRGCQVDRFCRFCALHEETGDHLFFECIFVRYLGFKGAVFWSTDSVGGDVRKFWSHYSELPDTVWRSKCLSQLVAIWWVVWTERNGLCFSDAPFNSLRALERVGALIKAWNEVR